MNQASSNTALTVSVADLSAALTQFPTAPGTRLLRNGPLVVREPDPLPADREAPGRRQIWLGCPPHFVLVADEFRTAEAQEFTLAIAGPAPLTGGRRKYLTADAAGPLAVHPLGDYRTRTADGRVTLAQTWAFGRFLLAATRDPEGWVRVLNGWAVEVRAEGRVWQLLHANRARKPRPLGPIQTDSRYALLELPADGAWSAVGLG
jgi:hypothetical protein